MEDAAEEAAAVVGRPQKMLGELKRCELFYGSTRLTSRVPSCRTRVTRQWRWRGHARPAPHPASRSAVRGAVMFEADCWGATV